MIDSKKSQADTNQYYDLVREQISLASGPLDLGESLVGQMPIIKAGAQYSWLLYALEGLLLVLFIGSLLTKNIAGLAYWALKSLFIKEADAPAPQPQPAKAKEKGDA